MKSSQKKVNITQGKHGTFLPPCQPPLIPSLLLTFAAQTLALTADPKTMDPYAMKAQGPKGTAELFGDKWGRRQRLFEGFVTEPRRAFVAYPVADHM